MEDNHVIDSLRTGKVTARITSGDSMRPVLRPGQRQVLVPVLAADVAAWLGCKRFDPGEPCEAGDSLHLTPADLRVGDAVFCRVVAVFTHEIIEIRGDADWPEFLIARHDKKIDGWTRAVFGKCVRVED